MATRSYIAIQNSDGSITGIYCHYDGYPEGVGATLTNHYNNTDLVNELLELGSLSSLGTNLEETVAYHRDRGEDKEDNITFENYAALLANAWNDMGVEYAYVWDGNAWSGHHVVR